MVARTPRTFLQRSAAWARAEVNVELLRCGYAARCTSTENTARPRSSATSILAATRYARSSSYAMSLPTR